MQAFDGKVENRRSDRYRCLMSALAPTPLTRRRRPSYVTRRLAALRYPDFRTLWLSTVANQLGWGMQQVLLGWLILDLTGSAGMVGVIYAVRSLPNLVVGLAAGSLADRFDRRRIMRYSCAAMLTLSLLMAWALFDSRLAAANGSALLVGLLLASTFLMGVAQAFYMTARQVYVYDIVGPRRAVNGIALVSLAQWTGGIFGSLITGGLIAWQGPAAAFLVMGLTYLAGLVVMRWLRQAGAAAPRVREPLLENLLNYFRALKNNRVMLSLIISTAGAEILGFSHQVMLPLLAVEVLGVGAAGLGLLTAFRFLGSALGVFAVVGLERLRRRGLLLLTIIALFGLGQIMLSQSPTFWVAVLFVIFINLMASATDILHHALMQFSVSNQERGRAMGSWIIGIGAAPLGQMEGGYLAEATNARVALLVNGAALIALAVIMGLILPRLRRL